MTFKDKLDNMTEEQWKRIIDKSIAEQIKLIKKSKEKPDADTSK